MEDLVVPGEPENWQVQSTARLFELRVQELAFESHFVVWAWLCAELTCKGRVLHKTSVGEIVNATGLHRNTVSKVLNELAEFGIIRWEPKASGSVVGMVSSK